MTLTVKWQRLVHDDKTCKRCSLTEKEVEKGVEKLKKYLDKDVKLKKEKISKKEFKENPKSSNRIFINEKSLEDWIGAEIDETDCCDVCGDEECRTIIVGGEEYESVPSELVVKAGLKAASQKISCCCSSERKNKH